MAYDPLSLIHPRFLRHPVGPVVTDNERQILRVLQRHPGVSRAELTTRFDLRQQSLHRIVDQLAGRGMVRLGPPRAAAGRGQPSPTLNLRPGFAFSWGLSLDADDLTIVLMDFAGDPMLRETHPLQGRSRDTMLDVLAQRMARIVTSRRLDPNVCLGIGVGIPEYGTGGTRPDATCPLREWSLSGLGLLMSERLERPVWVDSSANTAAVAETMLGVGRDIPTFAYMAFHQGFGVGLVHDGNLWMGGNSRAGDLSCLFTEEERKDSPTMESLLRHLQDHGVALSSVAEMTERFDPAWPGLEAWIDRSLVSLNRALAALWCVFDPQAVVLGGRMPPALSALLIRRAALHPAAHHDMRPVPALVASTLGPNTPALGAAAYPLRICAL